MRTVGDSKVDEVDCNIAAIPPWASETCIVPATVNSPNVDIAKGTSAKEIMPMSVTPEVKIAPPIRIDLSCSEVIILVESGKRILQASQLPLFSIELAHHTV